MSIIIYNIYIYIVIYLFIYLTLHEESPMIHRYPTRSTVSTSPVGRGVLGAPSKLAHPAEPKSRASADPLSCSKKRGIQNSLADSD